MSEHVDSNYGPSACKADALNQLSYAPIVLAPRFELGLLPWKGRDLTIGRHEHKSRVLHPLAWRWDLTALLGNYSVVCRLHALQSIRLKGSGLSQFNIALCYSDPVGIWTRGPYIKSVLLYQLSYRTNGDSRWIQTIDPQLRRLLLYSLSYGAI